MSALFADGRIIDAILVLVALEALALVAFARRTGRVAPAAILANLLAGASLMLALRLALAGTGWPWIGLALMAALVAHLADLRQRFAVPRQRMKGAALHPGAT